MVHGWAQHGIRRLHLRRDPARSADGRAGRCRQELRRRFGADRARRSGRPRRLRPRRASPAGLCSLGAGRRARRGGGAHQAHPADQRRHGAVVGRSGARLSAVRDPRSHLRRTSGDHGRARFVHQSFPLFGYNLDDYDELFAEKLDLLLAIRAKPKVAWKGRHRASLNGQTVYPRALQQPPVWIASGGTPQSVARAGMLGLPLAIAIIGGERRGLRRWRSSTATPAAAPASPRRRSRSASTATAFLPTRRRPRPARFFRPTPR